MRGRAEHVRRATARRDRDDGVVRADGQPLEITCARLGVVLCTLLRLDERLRPPGHHGDDSIGVERRAALCCVENPEPSGGAGADVDEPAAACEPLRDRVDGRCDRGRRGGDRGGDARVLLPHQPDELLGRGEVDRGQVGAHGLGDKVIEAVSHCGGWGRGRRAGRRRAG